MPDWYLLTYLVQVPTKLITNDVNKMGWPPKLHGIICANHHAVAGSNLKHTIYAFSICIIEIVMKKGRKLTKRGRDWPIFNVVNKYDNVGYDPLLDWIVYMDGISNI